LENNFYNPQNSPIKELIHFVWQVERINFEITQETILPKGIIEIIFDFNDDPTIFENSRMEPTDSRYVNEELKSPAGPYDNIIPLNLHIYLIGGNNVGASEVFLDPLNTVQVFGIKNNGEMVELALKDIPKNEILPLLNYKVSIPLEQLGDLQVYKGLKVQFNNKTTAQMGVHEFVLEGYIYE